MVTVTLPIRADCRLHNFISAKILRNAAHFEVSRQIVEAGKHVWTEKPLTTDPADAASLLSLAAEAGVRVGGAPDTVLGAGIQTALRTLREG